MLGGGGFGSIGGGGGFGSSGLGGQPNGGFAGDLGSDVSLDDPLVQYGIQAALRKGRPVVLPTPNGFMVISASPVKLGGSDDSDSPENDHTEENGQDS